MRGVRLSDTFAKQAAYQGPGACIYWDLEVRSYGLRVYPSGRKSWVVKFRVNRPGEKPRLEVVEKVERTREDLARLKAKRALVTAAEGQDPFPPAAPAQRRHTLGELFAEHYRLHVAPNTSKRHAKEVKRTWEKLLLPELGADTPIVDVAPARLLELRGKMADRQILFNAALSFLHSAFDHADRIYRWLPRSAFPDWTNPASRHLVQPYPKRKRDRLFKRDEAAAFSKVLEPAIADSLDLAEIAIGLIWLSGSRPSEVLGAQWTWIEWGSAESTLLKLPKAKGDRGEKTGRIIGFGPRGTALLRRAWQLRKTGNPYVLPSTKNGRVNDHLRIPYRAWQRFMEASGIAKPWPTPYAARHAYRTLSQGVVTRDAVKEQQGWKTEAMAEHYRDRLDDFQRAALVAMEAVLLPATDAQSVH